MTLGAVKRFTFLVGVVVVILGAIILMDPVATGPHNCGNALAPKPGLLPEIAERCEPGINHRRWLGGAVFAAGAVAVILPGPRCLLIDD